MSGRSDGFRDVRDANGDLVCRVDPTRALVEVKRPGRPANIVRLARFGMQPAKIVDKPANGGYNDRE